MTIKAQPFKTKIGEAEVEGFFEEDCFVFRFYGLVTFRPLVISIEDTRGKFAVLQDTEILHPDGFVFTVATEYDADLGCEWGYQVSLKRNEITERDLFEDLVKLRGIDPNSVNLIVPPRQLIAVYFDPHGVQHGSSQFSPVEDVFAVEDPHSSLIIDKVRVAADKQLLFLSHAVRQMSRPDRMITTREVHDVVATGIVIEDYPNDPRGPSCLILGRGEEGRPIHVVCSPKSEFLAIITAYVPHRDEWSDDFSVRTKR
jgi:hypothetical protein